MLEPRHLSRSGHVVPLDEQDRDPMTLSIHSGGRGRSGVLVVGAVMSRIHALE